MKKESAMSFEELKKLPEAHMTFDRDAFRSQKGSCVKCRVNLVKKIVSKRVFDGSVTFRIITLQCPSCKTAYLNFEEAAKYDLFLLLEKTAREKSLQQLMEKIAA